jgi:hypothetical protein
MNAFQDWSKQALNSPQPVPGMPWTPNEHWNDPGGGITGGAPVLGNRGSGQPISQPMATSQPLPWDGSGGQSSMGGSLQSLGGGMNQSGMVNLRGPDGSSQAVPQNDLAHWLSKGAVRV